MFSRYPKVILQSPKLFKGVIILATHLRCSRLDLTPRATQDQACSIAQIFALKPPGMDSQGLQLDRKGAAERPESNSESSSSGDMGLVLEWIYGLVLNEAAAARRNAQQILGASQPPDFSRITLHPPETQPSHLVQCCVLYQVVLHCIGPSLCVSGPVTNALSLCPGNPAMSTTCQRLMVH